MTFFQANAMLARISYKHGFRFYMRETGDRGAQLIIFATLPNSQSSLRERIEVMFSQTTTGTLLENYNEQRFLHWVRESVLQLEIHERDEWFCLDGKLVYDPHGPASDRLRGL